MQKAFSGFEVFLFNMTLFLFRHYNFYFFFLIFFDEFIACVNETRLFMDYNNIIIIMSIIIIFLLISKLDEIFLLIILGLSPLKLFP